MSSSTSGGLGAAVAAVCCGVLLFGCGAERQQTAADTTDTMTDAVTAEGAEREGSVSDTEEAQAAANRTTATTSGGTATTPPLTDPSAADMPTTDQPDTASETTGFGAGDQDGGVTSTTAPAAVEASVQTTAETSASASSVPTLEVVGGAQGAADRVPPGQTFAPFATFAEVTLVHPSIRVERIGFHESNHDGARQMEPTAEAVAPVVLESRQRGTGSRTAADIVVEPGTEIRAPVTGTVLRAGGYVLYCDHQDDFLVIEPDSHPGWEVKLLHINGVMVAAGDRVEAGVTVVAPEATVLPFDSQVDEFTAIPPWPHVHIELVDPSIPDRPSTGGGC